MFAGLIRTLGTIVLVWFVWRWLDRMFGGRRRGPAPASNEKPRNPGAQRDGKSRPDDNQVGEYVDYEEIDN